MAARLQTQGSRERDRLLQGLALFGRGLGTRQPGINQDRQVLLILLLELFDHQLAAPRRRAPVDPTWAVARTVIAQAVIFNLHGRAVVPLAAAVLGGLSEQLKPASR